MVIVRNRHAGQCLLVIYIWLSSCWYVREEKGTVAVVGVLLCNCVVCACVYL